MTRNGIQLTPAAGLARRARTQRRVSAHRGEEARSAKGVVARPRRDADADSVSLQLLPAREARKRYLAFRKRQRAEIGVAYHVGNHTAHDHRLAHLIFADGGMTRDYMRHLMREHRGKFG